jgi:hypothetical protein
MQSAIDSGNPAQVCSWSLPLEVLFRSRARQSRPQRPPELPSTALAGKTEFKRDPKGPKGVGTQSRFAPSGQPDAGSLPTIRNTGTDLAPFVA